mgnify:CR=1 FL=1|jgi:hypothetical protein
MNNAIKWAATAVTLYGALLTSLQVTPLNIYVLNLASAIWLIWAMRVKDKQLFVVNLGLLAIYALGLII